MLELPVPELPALPLRAPGAITMKGLTLATELVLPQGLAAA